jgi:transcriptional regulator with XRE-family HTH domain
MKARAEHWIAKLRLQHGVTQKQLAKAAGCSPSTIQAIELGKLKLSAQLAKKIHQALAPFDLEIEEWL